MASDSDVNAVAPDPDDTVEQPFTKRLIVCCDGTWQNSKGVQQSNLFSNTLKLEVPSNVTRISRSLRRACADGRTVQIIYYQSGVGSEGSAWDMFAGGALGLGIAANIREAYAFVCANYHDGDEIILIGFSRGAFTARAVAGMISDLGLLTRQGMEFFYPIFKDMQNWHTEDYKDPFPGLPFTDKPIGEGAEEKYRQRLIDRGMSRAYEQQGKGSPIKVRAVAVWDTVGSLGIPEISWLARLGIKPSGKELRFYDTNLSDHIEYAFQALALDENRPPFSPTVWGRGPANGLSTDLRQCWFPGNHGNVGGGWEDQGIANMSLAWMMDQLASIGVEFDEATVTRIFISLERYYCDKADSAQDTDPIEHAVVADTVPDHAATGFQLPCKKKTVRPWAVDPIYSRNKPVRPWALGAILQASGFFYKLIGQRTRTPGMYTKPDPVTGRHTRVFLENTNERVHSSVRVRLALHGLDVNDGHTWTAPALRGRWRLRRTDEKFKDPIPASVATWEPPTATDGVAAEAAKLQRQLSSLVEAKTRWVWEYCGPVEHAPPNKLMVEEPLGPYERQLLRLAGGSPNVYEYADGTVPNSFW